MLGDTGRSEAYATALHEVVTPESVVLDVGAGTGVLSLLAAMAGARHVYAVERTPVARFAREIVERNALSDRITVIEADIADAELPMQVDVIVSELLGGIGVDENFADALLVARGRWLRPGGCMVPSKVRTLLAPGFDDRLHSDLTFFGSRQSGLDLSPLADRLVHEVQWTRHHITPESVVAPPASPWTVDYAVDDLARLSAFDGACEFTVPAAARMNSIVGWFSAQLTPNVVLCTAPGRPNCWGVNVYPLFGDHQLAKGATVAVRLELEAVEAGWVHSTWTVAVGTGAPEHHQSRSALVES